MLAQNGVQSFRGINQSIGNVRERSFAQCAFDGAELGNGLRRAKRSQGGRQAFQRDIERNAEFAYLRTRFVRRQNERVEREFRMRQARNRRDHEVCQFRCDDASKALAAQPGGDGFGIAAYAPRVDLKGA